MSGVNPDGGQIHDLVEIHAGFHEHPFEGLAHHLCNHAVDGRCDRQAALYPSADLEVFDLPVADIPVEQSIEGRANQALRLSLGFRTAAAFQGCPVLQRTEVLLLRRHQLRTVDLEQRLVFPHVLADVS